MNNEQIIQAAIAELRRMQSELVLNTTPAEVGPYQRFSIRTIPAILSILRVTLKVIQIDPDSANTVNGYANEINLARAVIQFMTEDQKEYYVEDLPQQEDEDDF